MKDLSPGLSILILCLLSAAIYLHSVGNQFVLDDPSQITHNPAVHSLFNIPRLFLGSSFGGGNGLQGIYYKPVMTSSYTVIYSLFGSNPLPFHLFQLIIHTLNAILVFLIFKKFFNSNLSLSLSLIFLVHPVNSESVLYISSLQDPLFLIFGMLALLQITRDRLQLRNYFWFGFFMILSLFSKETGLLFLPVSIIYRLIFHKDKGLLGPGSLILVFYFLIRYLSVGMPFSADNPFPITRLSLPERLINLPKIVFYYLKTAFFPMDLAAGQQWVVRSATLADFYLPLIVDSAFLLGLIVLFKKLNSKDSRQFLFFLIWFMLGLGLHLQILPLDATVADRWMYFPIVGLLGMLGIILEDFKKYITIKRSISQALLIIFIMIITVILLSVRTFQRTLDWKDGLTLATHDTRITTDSFVMENNLGFELISAGRFEEAKVHIEKSTSLAPYWWLNWNNLGVVYRHSGNFDKAEEAFRKAAENTDTFYMPYENLAELLLYFKSPKEAENFIVQTSQKLGMSEKLWFLLSITEYKLSLAPDGTKLGNAENSLKAAQQALLLAPTNNTYQKLVVALQNNQTIIVEPPIY